MPAPAPDSALVLAVRQLAEEALERSRRAAPRAAHRRPAAAGLTRPGSGVTPRP